MCIVYFPVYILKEIKGVTRNLSTAYNKMYIVVYYTELAEKMPNTITMTVEVSNTITMAVIYIAIYVT